MVFGDPLIGEPDVVVAEDVLAFAGIAPPTLRLYPIETHIAEKLHAYTMPRARPNSRVKDLPDSRCSLRGRLRYREGPFGRISTLNVIGLTTWERSRRGVEPRPTYSLAYTR